MATGFFVTGTDTGIGKTHSTVRLMRFLKSKGISVIGMKPVASGAVRQGGRWVNADALALQRESSVRVDYEWVNPYVFGPPVSPHIAAKMMGVRVSLDQINEYVIRLATLADCVIVEGVGGWRVPLNADEDVSDLAKKLMLPVLQIVGLRLGCINHARLMQESVIASGVKASGWVANWLAPDLLMGAEVVQSLEQAMGQKALAELAFTPSEVGENPLNVDYWNEEEILRLMAA